MFEFKEISQKERDEIERESGAIRLANRIEMLNRTLARTKDKETKQMLIDAIGDLTDEELQRSEQAKYKLLSAHTGILVEELEEMDSRDFLNLELDFQDYLFDVINREIRLSELLAIAEFQSPDDKEMVLKIISDVYTDKDKKK